MFFLGSSGQSLLRVARFGLTYDEASELAAALRVPIDPTWDRPATFERLSTEIPGALTWSERHRGLYAALIHDSNSWGCPLAHASDAPRQLVRKGMRPRSHR